MSEPRDEIAEVLWRASWPDGSLDGFPTKTVAKMLADRLLASGWLAERDRRVAGAALREALDPEEDPGMLRARLLDAADRVGNPSHQGNRHAWPKHAEMFRRLADRIERGVL